MSDWKDAQEFERKWWGDCLNTFSEEVKQLTYSYKMGLTATSNDGKWPCYDLQGKSVLDIGGGPVSMLLKSENRGKSWVLDPCRYPYWVYTRYYDNKIDYIRGKGEDLNTRESWDEVWIYNVLQHTENPELIISNAKAIGTTIRIFEWICIPPHEGHPQELTQEGLDLWLQGTGAIEQLSENNCYGLAYYGVFHKEDFNG